VTTDTRNAPGGERSRGVSEEADVVTSGVETRIPRIPFTVARFVPPNALVVDECPHCGRTHRHGAGNPAPGTAPAPSMYGHRVAHCLDGAFRSYDLVPAEVSA
jgi:hypothetical protein